jgi:hypothetical protein
MPSPSPLFGQLSNCLALIECHERVIAQKNVHLVHDPIQTLSLSPRTSLSLALLSITNLMQTRRIQAKPLLSRFETEKMQAKRIATGSDHGNALLSNHIKRAAVRFASFPVSLSLSFCRFTSTKIYSILNVNNFIQKKY